MNTVLKCSVCDKTVGYIDNKGKIKLVVKYVFVSTTDKNKKIYNCSTTCLHYVNTM